MTVREIYEAVLIELNKENSQSFTIEEFNYVFNKAVLALVNEKYNFNSINQQLSDDLRVLYKYQNFNIDDTTDVDPTDPSVGLYNPTAGYVVANVTADDEIELTTSRDLEVNDIITFDDREDDYTILSITDNVITISEPITIAGGANVLVYTSPIDFEDDVIENDRVVGLTFKASDYLHLLSCTVLWKTKRPVTNAIMHIKFPAKRLTQDMHNAIQNNVYLTPAPNRPYYQLFNTPGNIGGVAMSASPANYKSLQNKPKLKIYLGNKTSAMELRKVVFEYIKLPSTLILTDEDIYTAGSDTSQTLELPDYLKNEVVRRTVIYLLEKASDPRIQTHPAFNGEMQSIPMNMQISGGFKQPVQQQTTQNQQ